MKWVSLPKLYRGKTYTLCPFTGALLSSVSASSAYSRAENISSVYSQKLDAALKGCSNPYLLSPSNTARELGAKDNTNYQASHCVSRAVSLCYWSFLFGRLYAGLRVPLFDTCTDSIDFFNEHPLCKKNAGYCLPRSFFAAKTSKSFEKTGVVVIGIFLPTTMMHAWVIDNGAHADPADRIWTQYQPVGAFV